MLDPDDFTTHAVIVGMTGSGKTGLGVVLVEEALSRGIPALILDPKGDMGNLALTFADLSAASFRPWIDESAARDAGQTPDEYAEATAQLWKRGLAEHGISPERIEALRAAAEVTLYTPGSEAGVPLNVIGSLKAPKLSWETDEETIRDQIERTVTSLLGLVGIEADPLGSREHVLLSNLLEHNWRAGTDLDLGVLIGAASRGGDPGALARPRGAVGFGGRRRRCRKAAPGLPRCPREPSLRRHQGRARHDAGVGGAVRAAGRRARPGPRDGGRLRRSRPARGAAERHRVLPSVALDKASFFRDAAREIQRRLTDTETLELMRNAELGLYSRPGETEEQFAPRADEAAKAKADEETAKIRDRLEAKRDRLERALETSRRRVEEAATEQSSRKSTELLSGLGSVVGVLLGGKADTRTIARAGRALGGAASRRGMTTRASERKQSAEEKVELAETELEELEQEILDEVAEIDEKWAQKGEAIETVPVRLEAADVRVVETTLVWVPTA